MRNISGPQEDRLSGQAAPLPAITSQPTSIIGAVSPTAHWAKQKGREHSRRKVILCCCIGLFILATSLLGSTLYLYQNYNAQYHGDMALAQEGVHHLQTAEGLIKNLTQGSLDSHSVTQARQEFAEAFTAFGHIENDLEQVPGIATVVPKYGNLLSSALRLVPLAIKVSQVGIVSCDALSIVVARLQESLNIKAQGITMEDLAILKKDVAEIQGILKTVADQVGQLQPSDLQVDARLGPAVAAFRAESPGLQTGLQDIQSMLSVAPTLFGIGQPASFLIEQLDSTEIRPGGGFIGGYGIVSFSGGRLANMQMRDTYLLDDASAATGRYIPYPSAYKTWFHLTSSWSLRDSNLDADFPTAARYAEQLYHIEGGTVPLEGVIAITPWFMENALKITGPISVPEYRETITAQNLVDRIHFHQLEEEWKEGDVPSPDGHSSLRKRFTELLFEHFFVRVRQLAPTAMPHFVSLLYDSLHTKDVQIYLNSNTAENLLQHYQLASTIQSLAGDSLFTVDADIAGGKPNNFIHYTVQDEVTIDESGDAIHRTTLTYKWPVSANPFQNGFGNQSLYTDYMRVYTPPDTTLLAQSGWSSRGTSQAFGREVWAGLFTLPYGQTKEVNLTWKVHGAATHDANGWHYHYLIQRQAGIMWYLNIQVTLPSCAHAANASSKPVFSNLHNGTLNQSLAKDLDIGVSYSC